MAVRSAIASPNVLASTPERAAAGDGQAQLLDIQRARLIAAMTAEAALRGPGEVTVARVVKRAGVSRRTFYELFEHCDDCFLAAFDDALARLAAAVGAGEDPGASWLERLRAGVIAALAFLDAERDAGRLLLVGSLGAGPDALERRARALAPVTAFVARGGRSTPAASSELTAEGAVGGALSIVHARLLRPDAGSLLTLAGPLTSMIVLPYRGAAAARRELERPAPAPAPAAPALAGNPLRGLRMRLTYRTVLVLAAVAAIPGGSNRQLGHAAGIADQGQISKLLTRLQRLGLIENTGGGAARGAPNAWTLTDRGRAVEGTLRRRGELAELGPSPLPA